MYVVLNECKYILKLDHFEAATLKLLLQSDFAMYFFLFLTCLFFTPVTNLCRCKGSYISCTSPANEYQALQAEKRCPAATTLYWIVPHRYFLNILTS